MAHNRKEVCDSNFWSKSKEKEKVAKMIESIAKMGPFKTWILTPASSVWIQSVSVAGMSVTGILLILYLFNFVAKFSKIPWNFFEMAFCIAMAFFYFTCGLDLFIKGSKLCIPRTIKLYLCSGQNLEFYHLYGDNFFHENATMYRNSNFQGISFLKLFIYFVVIYEIWKKNCLNNNQIKAQLENWDVFSKIAKKPVLK